MHGMICKFALPLALSAFAVFSAPAAAQNGANEAADAAEAVAESATSAFERVDPDSEMPAAATPANDEAALTYAGLPPLIAAEIDAMAPATVAT
jgi:hypothetical protein